MEATTPTEEPAQPTAVVIAVIEAPKYLDEVEQERKLNFIHIDHEHMEIRLLFGEWLDLREHQDRAIWNTMRKPAVNSQEPYTWIENKPRSRK